LVAFFDAWRDGAGGRTGDGALWRLVCGIHESNASIWSEEDLARRRHVPDADIAANKRAIDRLNQLRNDLVENCDETVWAFLEGAMKNAPRLNSETPGQMIDRLSILSLKIAAMRAQAERRDVDGSHRDACRARLARLAEQRADLAGCFDALIADCAAGRARFKLYRQFKMYNDPTLNPRVYGEVVPE
jgi:hypothetical protein